MKTREKGKVIIAIAMAAIMLASVFAATAPIISAESGSDNFNRIVKQIVPQKVLIGQNLQFEGFDAPPIVFRLISGEIWNTWCADNNNCIYNVNWPTRGVYYVNYWSATDYDASLSLEYVDMPLELKVVGTMLILDTTGINLFPQDRLDLVVIGSEGQIKIDEKNNQTFTNITVSQLMVFGDAGLKTEGWKIGNYTFQVKTRSANACGLEAASAVKNLKILKDGYLKIIEKQRVHNINIGENFSTIQAAIDDFDTKDGHTITVDPETYYENVIVNKSVTLKGIGHPVVDAGGEGSAITLCADGITLVGFTATNSGSSWECAGIMVISSDNIITGNNASNNNLNGILLDYSSNNNSITGNNVSNNNLNGILLDYSSNNNSITGNNVSNNNWDGISLYFSNNNNIIRGNNVSNNNWDGISLYFSNNNNITGNTFLNDGLNVEDSYQNIVEENIVNGKPLVYLEDVSDHRVEDAGQVILVNCDNITVENLNLSYTSVGIELLNTEDSKVLSNTVSNNNGDGIRLSDSSDNIITGNNASNNNYDGIRLYNSHDNIITGNNASNNNRDSISLSDSSDNIITGNNASNNGDGISLSDSSDNIITGNNASNNGDGISLSDSSDNRITGNNASNNGDGISLSDSHDNIITGNNASNNNYDGISLSDSHDNSITGNNASNNNLNGISLYNSHDNIITGNNASNSNWDGIYLYFSNNNTITGNNVNNNVDGIHLWVSSNNTIYFNNFINNTNNVDSYKSTNIWNSPLDITYTYDGATYVSYLGNYWDDYEERYPDAEKIDSTGIWDTPYRIDEEEDNYPLMKPFENYNIIPTSAHT